MFHLCHLISSVYCFLLQNSDCDPKYTRHVDSFLYDNELLHELTAKGVIESHYCVQCGSTKTKSLSKEDKRKNSHCIMVLKPGCLQFMLFFSFHFPFCISCSNSIHV